MAENKKQEEMIDVYDADRKLTGKVLPRSSRLNEGEFMLYVLALIRNPEGQYLVTRRSLTKKWAAGSWEIPGGGADAGETSYQAVCREVLEETGLDLRGCPAEVIYSYCNEDLKRGDNYFVDIYLCQKEFTLSDIVMQKAEVIDTRAVSFEELRILNAADGFLHFGRICEALKQPLA